VLVPCSEYYEFSGRGIEISPHPIDLFGATILPGRESRKCLRGFKYWTEIGKDDDHVVWGRTLISLVICTNELKTLRLRKLFNGQLWIIKCNWREKPYRISGFPCYRDRENGSKLACQRNFRKNFKDIVYMNPEKDFLDSYNDTKTKFSKDMFHHLPFDDQIINLEYYCTEFGL